MLRRGKPGTQFSRTWRKIGQAWVVFPLSFHLVDLVVSAVKLALPPSMEGKTVRKGGRRGPLSLSSMKGTHGTVCQQISGKNEAFHIVKDSLSFPSALGFGKGRWLAHSHDHTWW